MEFVAFPAVRAIPARNGGRTSDQRKIGEGLEIRVAFVNQAVDSVRARDSLQRSAAGVIFLVIGDADALAGFRVDGCRES